MAILHQTGRAKQPPRTEQTDMELKCKEPQSLNHQKVMNTEIMHAEELEDIHLNSLPRASNA